MASHVGEAGDGAECRLVWLHDRGRGGICMAVVIVAAIVLSLLRKPLGSLVRATPRGKPPRSRLGSSLALSTH